MILAKESELVNAMPEAPDLGHELFGGANGTTALQSTATPFGMQIQKVVAPPSLITS